VGGGSVWNVGARVDEPSEYIILNTQAVTSICDDRGGKDVVAENHRIAAMDSIHIPRGAEMPYESESDLVAVLMDNVHEFVEATEHFVVTEEVRIGAGIVDVLLAVPQVGPLRYRLQRAQEDATALDIHHLLVMSHLYYHRPLKARTIAKRTLLDEENTKRILDHLSGYGYVECPSGHTFVRSPHFAPYFERLVCIEAKLNKWEEALAQAVRNRLFATDSYVALDASRCRAAVRRLDIFQEANVGLAIAKSSSESVEILFRPRTSRPLSRLFWWEATEVLVSRLTSSKTLVSEELRQCLSL